MSSEGLAAHMLGKSPAPWALVCPLLTALQTNALVQLEPTPLITITLYIAVAAAVVRVQEALSARLGQVAEFTAQADALKAAAAGLERQISSTAEQVRTNNPPAAKAAATFC